MRRKSTVDKPFLICIITILFAGFLIFISASMGLHARDGASFSSILLRQTFIGLILGAIALIITSNIPYRFWRKHAFYIFLGALMLTGLVFIPGIGIEHNGAQRWVGIFGFTFQPAEFLKFGFVIYLAAWLSGIREKIQKMSFGLLPIVILLAIVGGMLALQPDVGTLLIISFAALGMFLTAGARMRDIAIILLIGIIASGVLLISKPYILDRFSTFLNPEADPHGSGYQIQQSLIAIGSGGLWGRGFGQGVQKFNFLPEPVGDSIFAVAAEEFGFIGSLVIIGLFVLIGLRGLSIASRAPDMFGGLMVVGIAILIVSQSFINIASMLGIFPLTGMPLLFVSQGGTALLTTLAGAGIILNVSKSQRSKPLGSL